MEDRRQSIDDSRDLLDSDDVEETVFDYQSQNDKQIGKQLVSLFTWGTMGLVYAVPGPNLLDMACKMNTTLERLGLIFIGRSIGSLAGKYLSSCLVHRSKGYGIMTVSLVALMIFQSVLPLASSLLGAIFIIVALGGAHGLLSEGYRMMDVANGLYKGSGINKQLLVVAIGAAIAPVISSPFFTTVTKYDPGSNHTAQISNILEAKKHLKLISIFPGTICPPESNFGKSFWLTVVPCIILLLIHCYFVFQDSTSPIGSNLEQANGNRNGNLRLHFLNLVLFAVLFLYKGVYRLMELVIFTFIVLGPFEINNTKASLFVMLLWIAFAFAHILQQIIFLKIFRTERQLAIVFIKACICFVMSVVLLKTDSTNALTISLFLYMFFLSELGPLGQDIFLKQSITTVHLSWKLEIFADAFAEIMFPAMSLALMYKKGWQALAFVIIAISVLQFLACSLLALCPLAVKRDILSLNYEHLSSNKHEDGNRRRMRKEISKLLGGYTDQEVSYVTSDEEVVFDKRRQKNM